MSDINSTNPDTTGENPDADNLDEIEEQEDQRETAQVDESLEEGGLLPVPEPTPADGQAPGA